MTKYSDILKKIDEKASKFPIRDIAAKDDSEKLDFFDRNMICISLGTYKIIFKETKKNNHLMINHNTFSV